jgi:uncharacterized protein (TIGR02117 family)
MPRRRSRRRRSVRWGRAAAFLVTGPPLLYVLAALIGGLMSVNRQWREPDDGITVYLASNGVHADLILPRNAQGLDWTPIVPPSDFRKAPAGAQWVAFGAGERAVYLNTPTWGDLTLKTAYHALTGGERVMHVEWVRDPSFAARAIRLRPEEYRRLWASIRGEFRLDANSRPQRIDHPGYTPADRFYLGVGKTSAIQTCNQWIASRLRLAGVKAPLWAPFVGGLTMRYRPYRT